MRAGGHARAQAAVHRWPCARAGNRVRSSGGARAEAAVRACSKPCRWAGDRARAQAVVRARSKPCARDDGR